VDIYITNYIETSKIKIDGLRNNFFFKLHLLTIFNLSLLKNKLLFMIWNKIYSNTYSTLRTWVNRLIEIKALDLVQKTHSKKITKPQISEEKWSLSFSHKKNMCEEYKTTIQVSLVIRGRYVPLFWTVNTEFEDKKTHFD